MLRVWWYYFIGDGMFRCDLNQINRVKHSLPITIKTHTHEADELTYFISGSGTTTINGKTVPYKAGDFAFYKKGTLHDECDPNPCEIIWMLFDFEIEGIELNEGVYSDEDGKLLSALQKLRRFSLEQNQYSLRFIEITLAETVVLASEKQNAFEVLNDKVNWKNILNYIDTNINEQIDFKELAAKHHYSYDHFRHLFVRHFGISPYAYLTNQRISHAKRLLESSASSVTEIGLDCGFNSSSQFINVFKRYTKITPKSYRKNFTKNKNGR